ncbi:hypothetical protein BZA77DRAFT_101434 [Pyronema omphalodes]|nr:hypothetical protein BZA77DRAFT_114019 [Pyronema omphalodes]KAI5814339.1 hypothetical protein BZA77DRAFT_101434 [Pyronema omphalodes]
MPRPSKRRRQCQQVAREAAAKRRCAANISPESKSSSDPPFSSLGIIQAETEVEAQESNEGGNLDLQVQYRDQRLGDRSESMSGSEERVSGSDVEINRPDEIGDDLSKAEASSECESEIDESNMTQGACLGLNPATSWAAAEAKLPGNSRQAPAQTLGARWVRQKRYNNRQREQQEESADLAGKYGSIARYFFTATGPYPQLPPGFQFVRPTPDSGIHDLHTATQL